MSTSEEEWGREVDPSPTAVCVNMSVYTLLYVEWRERWQLATMHSLTGAPSSSLSSSAEANFGRRASSSTARLRLKPSTANWNSVAM